MKIDNVPTRTVRPCSDGRGVEVIDQTVLPHRLAWARLSTLDEACHAIRSMQVRGAPLIGAAAAYGLALALDDDPSDASLDAAVAALAATRPTAVNLAWALGRMRSHVTPFAPGDRARAAWDEAAAIADEDAVQNRSIGEHGLRLLRQLVPDGQRPIQVMTHCNAGWLATVDWGTALAPVYAAHDMRVPVHVWVSETRPRNQGLLTAWELAQHGVPHTLVADNAAGLLLRRACVDAVIVGADRIAANADIANKVGTYLKALACSANGVPFYVAAPRSTLDFACPNGESIPIETRDGDELRVLSGLDAEGRYATVRQLAADEVAYNPAFDVTPARLVTAIITERGSCSATGAELARLYPELKRSSDRV